MTKPDDTYLPRRLDDAWKIGIWDVDVAVPVILGLFLGWLAGSKLGFVLLAGAGIYASRRVARLKASAHPALALHWAYWWLPPNPFTALKATPPAAIERMVG